MLVFKYDGENSKDDNKKTSWITCESCLNDLGTLDDYIASNLGTANDYYEELKNCQDICDSTFDPCRFAYELFQMDMTPGGQYAEYLNQNNQIDPSQHNFSIFNANTLLQHNPAMKIVRLDAPHFLLQAIPKQAAVELKQFVAGIVEYQTDTTDVALTS